MLASSRPDHEPQGEDGSNSRSASAHLDLAIIGGGPAALSAALYAARAGLKTEVFERATIGGALSEISHLSNYPGFDGSGPDLTEKMRAQAIQAGAKITYGDCQKLWPYDDYFELTVDDEPVFARQVLVATGSEPRHLSFTPRPPISYCALCDGSLAKGKHVAVIGGANSAIQESLYLANLVEDLTIITHSRIKADKYLQHRLAEAQKTKNIKVIEDTEPTPELLDTFDYVFVFIGKRPSTKFLRPLADNLLHGTQLLNRDGYILTTPGILAARGVSQGAETSASPHATIIPGLYAAGDVRLGSIKQVVTAAADGAAAAIEIATASGLSSVV